MIILKCLKYKQERWNTIMEWWLKFGYKNIITINVVS